MLKITEAFSYAREYCDVGLWVKASNLAFDATSESCPIALVGATEPTR